MVTRERLLTVILWNQDWKRPYKNTFADLFHELHIDKLELASLLSDLQLVGWLVYVKENEHPGYYKLTLKGVEVERCRFRKINEWANRQLAKQIEQNRS